MVNPFNTSDANVPFDEQDQDAIFLSSRVAPKTHSTTTTTTTIVTPEKHLLLVEDYDSMPPSYSDTQEEGQQKLQTSSEAMQDGAYDNDGSNEASELETAPLMAATQDTEDDDYRYPPTAPSIDQMEFGLPPDTSNSNSSKHSAIRKKRCTVYRVYLAFAIFAIEHVEKDSQRFVTSPLSCRASPLWARWFNASCVSSPYIPPPSSPIVSACF
ncbi:hypothetical protein MBANPS3_009700 [Mucor bainieri]